MSVPVPDTEALEALRFFILFDVWAVPAAIALVGLLLWSRPVPR